MAVREGTALLASYFPPSLLVCSWGCAQPWTAFPVIGFPMWRSYNSPIDMGKERGDGGHCAPRDLGPAACHRPISQSPSLAARAFAFVRHRDGSSASWFSVLDAQAPRWHIFGVQGGPIWRQQLHQSFSIRRRRSLGFRPPTVRFTYWTTLRAKRARSSFSSAIIVLMSKR